ncbi:serine hydroxymethyltransferase [hydrocarbon metagenome]|uniref:Serine hydroxymethyltransferase n=1 Tax=hydrocarbon metagenome TaxID=938273 RepID=A0A0W8FEV6_9ZZZZ|nr:serine hydroxymethyltransferase [Methanomicrobiaceae archaeon]
MSYLATFDPEIAGVIEQEYLRQINGLELIASENIVSRNVLEATGSILTNKYAEGYPGKRYYGGCEFHDIAEDLARERMKRLFGAEHANVQPHSGSQANMAIYFACLQPKDKIMSQSLSQGGHLSHGSPVNFSGRLYSVVQYGVDPETEILDYGSLSEMARKEKPDMIVCGASAYPREIDFAAFAEIAEDVGAHCLADIAHIAGLCATGVHNSPIGTVEFTSTTTHKTLRGPRGGAIMCDSENAALVDRAVFPGMQGGPLMHIIAAKAVCLKEALEPSFAEYSRQIVKNARAMAESIADAGLRLVSGGTDNHLMLIDLTDLGITGIEAEAALQKACITVNKNTIPRETRSPFVTSGIRIGTPTLTSRGMKEGEMRVIGKMIARILSDITNEQVIRDTKDEVVALSRKYPIYPDAV